MNLPLVSVIVPVYKVEAYLERCLDSIVHQTYRNLEVILVDDGSPDNCGVICDRYADADSRIQVIHLQNGGVAKARNAALDKANGEYLLFVDSDDYIAPELVEEVVVATDNGQADIVIYDYFIVDREGVRTEKSILRPDMTREEIQELILLDKCPSYLWNKFFRASLFDDVRMTSLRAFEDLMIMPQLFMKAEKIVYLPRPYYFYNHINHVSLTSSVNTDNKLNANSKYGLFRAWEEHEKVAQRFCQKAVDYSELRAMNSAIGGLVANIFKPVLSEKELENIRFFLTEKKRKGSVRIDTKYRILWWMADHFPGLCRIYGSIGVSIFKLKAKFKSRKK